MQLSRSCQRWREKYLYTGSLNTSETNCKTPHITQRLQVTAFQQASTRVSEANSCRSEKPEEWMDTRSSDCGCA